MACREGILKGKNRATEGVHVLHICANLNAAEKLQTGLTTCKSWEDIVQELLPGAFGEVAIGPFHNPILKMGIHAAKGLRSGIEANLHAVRAIWPLSAGWTKDGALGEEDDGNPSNDTTLLRRIHAEGVLDPRTDPNVAAEDATFTRYKPGTGFGSELFDARNGFNELNRYLMLWNVAHRWNRGSRFAFNRDWHWVRCLVRSEPGEPGLVIHSKEGITQGDYLAMSLYGVALMPLTSKMREAIPDALQPWYCDDAGMAGKALPNA
ncbi:hypothetical protein ACHAXA_008616 [Cyclostephanos tholiformis]|uniref:Uncharacterized protein n=1 Tax=Cyclostephanos tholiformis TaxID=382380 RepID=A0ABD3SQC0_9STRA